MNPGKDILRITEQIDEVRLALENLMDCIIDPKIAALVGIASSSLNISSYHLMLAHIEVLETT